MYVTISVDTVMPAVRLLERCLGCLQSRLDRFWGLSFFPVVIGQSFPKDKVFWAAHRLNAGFKNAWIYVFLFTNSFLVRQKTPSICEDYVASNNEPV